MSDFTGFTDDLHAFFTELGDNNHKPWWEANKARYEQSVRGPALALIREMGPRLERLSPAFVAIAKKQGGSIMRPYRDIRFSKDKRPYKTNLGIQFRHEAGKSVHAPGFYLHVGDDGVFAGVGMWHPDSAALAGVREAIDTKPEAWRRVRDDAGFRARYELAGESLKRVPRGYPKEHPLAEDLKRKDHIAVADLDRAWVLGADLPERLAELFAAASPYMGFLTRAVGLRF